MSADTKRVLARRELTAIELICQIARRYNLDSSDVVVWALEETTALKHLHMHDRLDDNKLECVLEALEANGSQRAIAAKRLIEATLRAVA